jgi:hypothetical protein
MRSGEKCRPPGCVTCRKARDEVGLRWQRHSYPSLAVGRILAAAPKVTLRVLSSTASDECAISSETGSLHRSKWVEQNALHAMKVKLELTILRGYRCRKGGNMRRRSCFEKRAGVPSSARQRSASKYAPDFFAAMATSATVFPRFTRLEQQGAPQAYLLPACRVAPLDGFILATILHLRVIQEFVRSEFSTLLIPSHMTCKSRFR